MKTGAVKALAGGGLFPAAPAVAAPGSGLLAGLMGKLAGFGGVVKGIGLALGVLTIKLVAIGAVVAVVAGLVYKYWEPLKAFVSGVWTGFIEALQPVRTALEPLFAAIGEWIAPVIQWFRDLFVPVEMTGQELSGFAAVGQVVGKVLSFGMQLALAPILAVAAAASLLIDRWTAVKTFFNDLVTSADEFGGRFLEAIGDGIRGAAARMLGPLKWVLDKARALLPSSDARRGPLSKLTSAGGSILETMGAGVLRAGPGGLMRRRWLEPWGRPRRAWR